MSICIHRRAAKLSISVTKRPRRALSSHFNSLFVISYCCQRMLVAGIWNGVRRPSTSSIRNSRVSHCAFWIEPSGPADCISLQDRASAADNSCTHCIGLLGQRLRCMTNFQKNLVGRSENSWWSLFARLEPLRKRTVPRNSKKQQKIAIFLTKQDAEI